MTSTDPMDQDREVAEAAPPFRARHWRAVGAITGTILALGVLAATYALAAFAAVESVVHVRSMMAPDSPLGLAAWIGAGAAAFTAGWLLGSRAAGGARWAGAWMGTLTYLLTLVFAWDVAIVSELPRTSGSALDLVVGLTQAFFIVPIAAFILGPLLLVCLAGGVVWGWLVHLISQWSARGTWQPAVQLPLWPVIIVVAIVLIGWFASGRNFFSSFGEVGQFD